MTKWWPRRNSAVLSSLLIGYGVRLKGFGRTNVLRRDCKPTTDEVKYVPSVTRLQRDLFVVGYKGGADDEVVFKVTAAPPAC